MLVILLAVAAPTVPGVPGREGAPSAWPEPGIGPNGNGAWTLICDQRGPQGCAAEPNRLAARSGRKVPRSAVGTMIVPAARRSVGAASAKVDATKPVSSGLKNSALLVPKDIPPSSAPDVVGAFRFLCSAGQLSYDDPIVYPGEPGKAHLHQYFGNLAADAHSTYESLRTTGESSCQNELNRSAYWMPAMLDGKGNVVRPDFVSIYYKRRPASDPACRTEGKGCVGIPRGLRFVFGWDQTRPAARQPENATYTGFKCVEGWDPVTPTAKDLVEPMKVCKPGQRIFASLASPQCWNGVDLDTPDHRSHLADTRGDGGRSGQVRCPATHPYIIPQFTMTVAYSIEAGDDPTRWELSSDHMLPPALRRPGASFHSDYFEAWEDDIRLRWEAACIDQMLNCSDGDLGDGQIMARGKYYPKAKISPRLVPVPPVGGRDLGHERHEVAAE